MSRIFGVVACLLILSCGSLFGPEEEKSPHVRFQGRLTVQEMVGMKSEAVPREDVAVTIWITQLVWMAKGEPWVWRWESLRERIWARVKTDKKGYYRIDIPAHYDRPECQAGSCTPRYEDSLQAQGPMYYRFEIDRHMYYNHKVEGEYRNFSYCAYPERRPPGDHLPPPDPDARVSPTITTDFHWTGLTGDKAVKITSKIDF